MRISKKLISILLAALMAVSMMPFSAVTVNAATEWSFSGNTLTITGTGAMSDYNSGNDVPWRQYNTSINSIVISNGITHIGAYAFNDCKVTNVSLPNTVKSIGSNSFNNCTLLASVTFPSSLESIGSLSFGGCNFTQVTIPASVTTIGMAAFVSNINLTKVVFERPSTEKSLSIGYNAFYKCYNSAEIDISGSGADLYYGSTKIESGSSPSQLYSTTKGETKTFNWVVPTPVLPQATVTDITESEENTQGLDAAFKFEAPAGTTDYDDYYCDFKVSFDRDLTSDDIELWGQYGNYPWTNLASEASGDAYTIEKDTDYYLLRDIIQAPMTYAQIREIGTFLCGIKSHYGAAGATINVQLVLFEEPAQGEEIAPITLDEKEFVAPTEPDNGASITVAETISENFYLDDDFYGETAYVSFTYNHNSNVSEDADISTNVMAMASLDDATDGRKKFSVVQAPAQATEPITINVYANAEDAQAGTNAIDTIDYSVYTYCRDIIENYNGEKADEMKALAKSTLDYAAAAQTYFGYNTDDMATKDAQGDFYNEVENADLSNVAGVSAAPSCIKKASLVVKSDLEINLLSDTPIDVTDFSIAATTGTERFAVSTYQNGEYYVVHIAGIEPANMGKAITINTSQGDIVMTANSAVKMFANSNNANLSTLAKALFLYGNAANEYFG